MKTKLLLILLLACIAAPCLAEQGRSIVKGATDQTTYIKIVDAADGTPETGVVAATAGLDLEYLRLGAAAVDLTESDLASAIAAHSDGGIFHVGHGVYRVDLPDAAAASSAGVNEVHVQGTVTGMQVIGVRHPLVAYDPYDAVRLGMTALPNVPTGNAGAVLTAGTGTAQLNVASGNASANLKQIHGSNIPETTPGNIAFNFGWFWDNDNDTPGGIFLIDIAQIQERTNRIPNIAAGSAGGLFIAGTNAATTVNFTGSLSGSVGSVGTVSDKTGYRLSAAGVDDFYDELLSGHATAGTGGKAWADAATTAATMQGMIQTDGADNEFKASALEETPASEIAEDSINSVAERLIAAKNFKPNPQLVWVLRRSADGVGSSQVRRKKASEAVTFYADASPLLADGESILIGSVQITEDGDADLVIDADSMDVLGSVIIVRVSEGDAGETTELEFDFETSLDQEIEAEVPLAIGS